jgi:hypothetical protein
MLATKILQYLIDKLPDLGKEEKKNLKPFKSITADTVLNYLDGDIFYSILSFL